MEYLRRNILTVSLLLFAFAAFATELSGSLPADGMGADVAKVAVVALAAARGLVLAAEALAGRKDDQ